MSRTTLDIDPQVLEELKHMAAEQRESMSKVANRLLREAVRRGGGGDDSAAALSWHCVERGAPAAGFDPSTRDYLDLIDEA